MSYTLGLHEIADGTHAYLQPDGGWGWSNAGLVVGDGASLLVDTLFDLNITQRMLDAMAPHTRAAAISTVVNTHANGDHCYGNQLVRSAEIIASEATAHDKDNMRRLVRDSVAVLRHASFADISRNVVAGSHGTEISELETWDDATLDEWILNEVLPVSHVSCSLSQSVDNHGRLRRLRGVVVADASVLPSVPHETPAAAVTIEALRIAQLLGEELG